MEEQKPEGGVWIPMWVVEANIPHSAKILYGVLQDCYGFEPTRKELADIVGCSLQRITELKKILRDSEGVNI